MAVTVSNINLDGENVVRFTCSVGDRVKVCPPVSYPRVEFNVEEDQQKFYKLGFIILDQSLGEFTGETGDCVYYQHNYSGQQIIQFSSKGLGDKQFYLVLEGITVHDHASIPQGGPAYATYYAQPPTTISEES